MIRLKNVKSDKISFRVELDGLAYECSAMLKVFHAETIYIIDIRAMGQIFRQEIRFDQITQTFLFSDKENLIIPEIAEIEFKISEVLSCTQNNRFVFCQNQNN